MSTLNEWCRQTFQVHSISRCSHAGKNDQQTLSSLTFCLVLSILACSALLVACQQTTEYPSSLISFEGLCGLSVEQFTQMDQSQVSGWLESQYGTSPTKEVKDGFPALSVGTQTGGGATVFLVQNHILMMDRAVKNGPNLGQVVAALGPPQSVYGTGVIIEKALLSIGLDYPSLGLSVYVSKTADPQDVEHEGRREIQLTEDYRIDLVECYVQHSSIEGVLHDRFSSFPITFQSQLDRREPWTGFGVWVPLK